jgi:DNA-binding Lrp family transcriptional regulator
MNLLKIINQIQKGMYKSVDFSEEKFLNIIKELDENGIHYQIYYDNKKIDGIRVLGNENQIKLFKEIFDRNSN